MADFTSGRKEKKKFQTDPRLTLATMSTTSMSKTDGQPQPIITYCIEYAESQNSKCAGCNRTIPNKSLRCGEISRKSKKEKKQLSKTTWYHFKCFPGK